jgi:hypothetical protein
LDDLVRVEGYGLAGEGMDGYASRVAGDGTKLAVPDDMEVVLLRAEARPRVSGLARLYKRIHALLAGERLLGPWQPARTAAGLLERVEQ